MRMNEIEWQGEQTLAGITAGLQQHGRVEVVLPHNFNHAVFKHLCVDASSDVEQIDVHGGSELVRALAQVDGLEDLTPLAEVVEKARAKVHIVSPPRIIINCERSARL